MSVAILRADARCLPLADASVDLIVTSPPYFGLRSYTDGGEHYAGQIGSEPSPQDFLAALLACTAEWMRVLKPSGSMFVNLGDKYSDRQNPQYRGSSDLFVARQGKGQRPSTTSMAPRKSLLGLPWRYAIGCIDELGLILREEIIWSKPNALPESVGDRARRTHEQWFHFTLQEKYFAAMDEIREPHSGGSNPGRKDGRPPPNGLLEKMVATGERGGVHRATNPSLFNPLGRLPGSVWSIASEPLKLPECLGVEHYAAFPTEWPRRLIAGFAPAHGIVLDPFGGTGTTALVADVLGRTGISVDLSHDYCRLAAWRTADPAERARAARIDKPPVQTDGQTELFEALP